MNPPTAAAAAAATPDSGDGLNLLLVSPAVFMKYLNKSWVGCHDAAWDESSHVNYQLYKTKALNLEKPSSTPLCPDMFD